MNEKLSDASHKQISQLLYLIGPNSAAPTETRKAQGPPQKHISLPAGLKTARPDLKTTLDELINLSVQPFDNCGSRTPYCIILNEDERRARDSIARLSKRTDQTNTIRIDDKVTIAHLVSNGTANCDGLTALGLGDNKHDTIQTELIPKISVSTRKSEEVNEYDHWKPHTSLCLKAHRSLVISNIDSPGILESEIDDMNSIRSMKSSHTIGNSPKTLIPLYHYCHSTADPPKVKFESFKPNQIYVETLSIKNLAAKAQRFHVIIEHDDENQAVFNVSGDHSPTDKYGSIASGLSKLYTITFAPTSFKTYAASLIVKSNLGDSYIVPIFAGIIPSFLNIPPIVDLGFCIESKDLIFNQKIQNLGGSSNFSVSYANIQVEDSKTIQSETTIFSICPANFSLTHGQSLDLMIKYTPGSILKADESDSNYWKRTDSETITLECERGSLFKFIVTSTVQRLIMHVISAKCLKDDKFIYPNVLNTVQDRDCTFDLDFQRENVGIKKSFVLLLKSTMGFAVPFFWKITQDSNPDDGKLFDPRDMPFSINPVIGIFGADEEIEFLITFLSDYPMESSIIAELVAPNDALNYQKVSDNNRDGTKIARLKLFGEIIPYSISLSNELITIPFNSYPGATIGYALHLTNTSQSCADFRWEPCGIDPSLVMTDFSQPFGTIQPNSCIKIKVTFVAFAPCKIDGVLRCITANTLGPTLEVSVMGEIVAAPGQLTVNERLIDFGAVQLGCESSSVIMLKNSSKVLMNWRSKVSTDTTSTVKHVLTCLPTQGALAPEESCSLKFVFSPSEHGELYAIFEIETDLDHAAGSARKSMDLLTVDLVASTIAPRMIIQNDKIELSCFVAVPFKHVMHISNIGSTPAKFKFNDIFTLQYQIRFEVPGGIIDSLKSVQVKVQMTFLTPGESELVITGWVDGMIMNQGILATNFTVSAFEPIFTFGLHEHSKSIPSIILMKEGNNLTPDIDFGSSCKIFQRQTRTVTIRNHSACSCSFSIQIEGSNQSILDNNLRHIVTGKNQYDAPGNKTILRSANDPEYGFYSEGTQSCRISSVKIRKQVEERNVILADGCGVAFSLNLQSGIILPWSRLEIVLSADNNLAGIYTAKLVCIVGDICRILTVNMGVIGCPVSFDYSATRLSNVSDLFNVDYFDFGTKLFFPDVEIAAIDKSQSTRDIKSISMLVRNHSHLDVNINWSIYVKQSDLNASYSIDAQYYNNLIQPSNLQIADCKRIFSIDPPSMRIISFQSARIVCNFQSNVPGLFEALALAKVTYSRDFEGKAFSVDNESLIKLPSDISSIAFQSIAKFRVKSKFIKPFLELDSGVAIKFKQNSMSSHGFGTLSQVTSILTNSSEVGYQFTLETIPNGIFKVKSLDEYSLFSKSSCYSLQPKESIRISIKTTARLSELSDTEIRPLSADYKLSKTSVPSGKSNGKVGLALNKPSVVPQASDSIAHIKGHLNIIFANGTRQSVPIIVEI